MKKLYVLSAALLLSPLAAQAMPEVGLFIGIDPATATENLKSSGCEVRSFGAEGGYIEAKCIEVATGKRWEVYIDPTNGTVADMKAKD